MRGCCGFEPSAGPETTRAILECLGLQIRPPPVAEAGPDPGAEIGPLDDVAVEAGKLDLPA